MRARRASDNWGLKLLSVVLGFSLWYAVAREQGAEFAFSIPIELRNVPEGLEVIDESVQQVEVRLRGSTEVLRRLTPRDVSIGVDLSESGPGEHVAYFTPDDVNVPFGARVMRVTPASVALELDRTLERTVKLIPRVLGAPADGFELYGIELTPQEITVVGPASMVSRLEQITTQPVSAEGLRQPYSRSIRVELDPLIRLERGTSVEVTLDVREERLRKRFEGVPLVGLPINPDAQLAVEVVDVIVEGPRGLVEELTTEDLEAEARLDGLSSGRHRIIPIVRVRDPERLAPVHVVAIEPEEISVRIK